MYIIYPVLSGYIQQYNSSTSAFFLSSAFSLDEKKMLRFQGYAVGYSPPKQHLYITDIVFN